MRFWIVTPGEPAIYHPDVASSKPMRAALVATELARRGHQVVWWTGSFQHESKKFIRPAGEMLPTEIENLSLYLLASRGYRKNISISRLLDYQQLSREWQKTAGNHERPDLVLCSLPPIDLAYACLKFCISSGSKFVVDVRDLWPDVIYSRLFDGIPPRLIPPLLPHYEYMNRRLFRKSDAILGVTDAFVDWALEKVGRQRSGFDKGFYLSSLALVEDNPVARENALAVWASKDVKPEQRVMKFCWVGSLTDQKAIRTAMNRFAGLPEEIARDVQVVVCGKGTLEDQIKQYAAGYEHIIYGGYIDKSQYAALLGMVSYGLMAYEPTFDFQRSIPNKVNEYLSGGVHILTTLTGEVQRLLGDKGVYAALDLSTQEAFNNQIRSLVQRGPIDEAGRKLAKGIYEEHFSASSVYPDYADHLEMVAGFADMPRTVGSDTKA